MRSPVTRRPGVRDRPITITAALRSFEGRAFDFEADVERLIEKKLAEKAKEAEAKAKRDAARPAPATKQ